MFYPNIIEKTGRSTKTFDIPTKLLQDRIIYLADDVNEMSANYIVMQLLWLSSDDPKKDIYLYINSPGGLVTAGMAIYDIIQMIPNKVNTVCIGQCCSMGAFLLSTTTGKRMAAKHSRIMIHQPSGGAYGMASDIEIGYNEIQRMKQELTLITTNATNGKTAYEVMEKMMDRDTFLSAEEALNMGLIDEIITKI